MATASSTFGRGDIRSARNLLARSASSGVARSRCPEVASVKLSRHHRGREPRPGNVVIVDGCPPGPSASAAKIRAPTSRAAVPVRATS